MSEELDELASAYTDGEATPEEVARVESSPELLDLVDELRSVRASSLALPDPDPEIKQRHLAAALEAFDELQISRPSTLSVVTSAAAALEQDDVDELEGDGAGSGSDESVVVSLGERRKRRVPPAWMLNAAAALVVVGGVGFALTQLPSNTDDTASDAVNFSEADGESPDAASATNSASTTAALEREEFVAADAAASEAGGADADDAMSDQDVEADAMEDEATGESFADEEEAATEAAPSLPLFTVPDGITATEALAQFDETFGDEFLLTPPHHCQDIIDALVNPSTGITLGYVTIDYAGAPADLIVFDTSGERGALLLDPECGSISSQ